MQATLHLPLWAAAAALTMVLPAAARGQDAAAEIPMASYQMVFIRKGPSYATLTGEARQQAMMGHFQNIRRQAAAGKMLIAGPMRDGSEDPVVGLFLYQVKDVPTAKALAEQDPAVKAGVFKVHVAEWYAAAGITYPGREELLARARQEAADGDGAGTPEDSPEPVSPDPVPPEPDVTAPIKAPWPTKPYWVVITVPGPSYTARRDVARQAAFQSHLARLATACKDGKAIFGGPFQEVVTGEPASGMFVLPGDSVEQVKEWVAKDPLIQCGHMKVATLARWSGPSALDGVLRGAGPAGSGR